MKQTRTDTSIALMQAIGLHVLLFVLLFAGLKLSRDLPLQAAQGDPIEADLVAVSDLSASMQRTLQRKPVEPELAPAPVAEPLPTPIEEQPTPPQLAELPPPVPDPAPIDQEKVQRDAPTPATEKVQQEQEEKRRKPAQAELDAQPQELSARDKLLQEIRKQRELAARDRSMAEQRAQQLADARASTATSPSRPPPGDPSSLLRKSSSYQVALMNAILRQWTRPDSVKLGQTCEVLIKQIPGGEVVSVQVSPGCPYDELGRRSVEAAVMKASPLPYAGFEDVFVRDPVLKFRAEDL